MRKGQIIWLLCVLMLLSACRPKGILTSHQMRSVLYDLHRAEAVLQVAGYNFGHDEALAKYYQSVLDEHGITQAQFDSSLVWYTDHPQIFNKIYPKILTRCEQEDAVWTEWEHQQLEGKAKPDRELRPIADVEQEMVHGIAFSLMPPAVADTIELLLPLCGQPSEVSGQPSEVSGQPSKVSGQPSAVSSQPSEVSEPETMHVLQPVDSAIMRAKRKREQMLNTNQRF